MLNFRRIFMIRKKFLLFTTLCLCLVGCTNTNNNEVKEENQTNITTSYKEQLDNNQKIIFSGKTLSSNKYIHFGNLLFFSDIYNNDKLSVSNLPSSSESITNSSIIDNFDFNITSLATDDRYIFFSSISPERGLYKLDYEKKEITKINNDYSKNLILTNEKLYYINLNDNKPYYYSINDNKSYLLSNSTINNFIINNDSIFYINQNDGFKLYCLKIDGSANFNITDTAVESFVIYNDAILFSNSNDNNYIYSLDVYNLQKKKVLNVSAFNLKQSTNNIYFVSNESTNSLFKLLPSDGDSDYEYTELFPNYINEYYTFDNGVFIEFPNSLNSIKFISEN